MYVLYTSETGYTLNEMTKVFKVGNMHLEGLLLDARRQKILKAQ